ncbi:MAG: histidine phosphatase family protein [Gammaproteobacteria bacterium]|nr:histidine phosphatase family protein [Gammaproteobacteria bacterium]
MEKPETILTLIRHGLSDFNLEGRFQGLGNQARLSEKGVNQAQLVGQALGDYSFDTIFSSPLLRAKQTSEIIAGAIGHPKSIHFDQRLCEVDIPEWQGLKLSEIQKINLSMLKCFFDRPDEFEIQTSEGSRRPFVELQQRAAEFLGERIPEAAGSRVLVVSHLGTINALINNALGLSVIHQHRMQQSQCGISQLHFHSKGSVELTLLNDTDSLGQKLPKIKSQKKGVRVILMGFAKEANFRGFDFSLLGDHEHSFWVESVLEEKLLLSGSHPKPEIFNASGKILDSPISDRIKQLRMMRDLSSVLIAVCSESLPKFANCLFEIPQVIVGGSVNAHRVTIVLHDSQEHGKPIIQMLKLVRKIG